MVNLVDAVEVGFRCPALRTGCECMGRNKGLQKHVRGLLTEIVGLLVEIRSHGWLACVDVVIVLPASTA